MYFQEKTTICIYITYSLSLHEFHITYTQVKLVVKHVSCLLGSLPSQPSDKVNVKGGAILLLVLSVQENKISPQTVLCCY